MTDAPFFSDADTFSASARQHVTLVKSVSPSFHAPAARSNRRGVDASRNDATACPSFVNANRGSATRLPTTVTCVSNMVSPHLTRLPAAHQETGWKRARRSVASIRLWTTSAPAPRCGYPRRGVIFGPLSARVWSDQHVGARSSDG